MSWANATRDQILFTSPNYNIFSAKWKNNERSGEKKLGIFDPPKFEGSIVQDMGSKSTSWPLTVYFEGLNHYAEANRFWDALEKERGQWEVVHPTKGKLILQLVTYKESINPVDDGNFTTFETTWLQPANIERIMSSDELIVETLLAAMNAISDSVTQFKQLRADLYSAVQSLCNMLNAVAGLANSTMSELTASNVIVNDSWSESKSSLSSAINAFKADPSDPDKQEAVANASVDNITIPLEVSTDYDSRISRYSDLADKMTLIMPTAIDTDDYNKSIAMELTISAVIISISRIIVTSNFTTRTQIITAIEKYTAIFNKTINALESVQSLFDNLDIDVQYFSQSTAYGSLQILFSTTMNYLLSQFFNLKSEKRFTIKTPRSPIEVTVTEYGSLGENDINLDLFINSNNLNKDEILLLPIGREVVVYV
jgi:prophage DNA circulation protein